MNMTWWEWLMATEMWLGALTKKEKLWNATRWRIRVSEDFIRSIDVVTPRRFRFAYRHDWSDCYVYALPPIHLILRAWHWWYRHRYDLERWGILNGLYQMPAENVILSEGRWRWPSDLPAGGRRRACNEWPRERQLEWHERGIIWADNHPEEKLCS